MIFNFTWLKLSMRTKHFIPLFVANLGIEITSIVVGFIIDPTYFQRSSMLCICIVSECTCVYLYKIVYTLWEYTLKDTVASRPKRWFFLLSVLFNFILYLIFPQLMEGILRNKVRMKWRRKKYIEYIKIVYVIKYIVEKSKNIWYWSYSEEKCKNCKRTLRRILNQVFFFSFFYILVTPWGNIIYAKLFICMYTCTYIYVYACRIMFFFCIIERKIEHF